VTRPQIPDTGVFIAAIRDLDRWWALERSLASGQLWLSSVVVCELYAGTRSPDDALRINRIISVMERIDHLLVPTAAEWARAGRLMARHVRLRGPIRPRDHLADVLILVSAARLRGEVLTANLRHFEAWAKLAAAARLDVTVAPFEAQ
jgi:predicted nucleic acid-binding protein